MALRRRALVILAAAFGFGASMALAPQMAAGAGSTYVGDLVSPQVGPHGEPSAIQFKLALDKKKKGKLVPSAVRRFESRAVPLFCSDGSTTFYGGDGYGGVKFLEHFFSAPVKKRTFSYSSDIATTTADTEVTGQIPRSGPATGTLRITTSGCDSGVVSWTAAPAG